MKQQIVVRTEKGEEFLCTVVARWSNNNVDYIAYTDGTKTNNKLDLFVAKYANNNGTIEIIEIDDSRELEYVNKYLEDNLFKGDVDYD